MLEGSDGTVLSGFQLPFSKEKTHIGSSPARLLTAKRLPSLLRETVVPKRSSAASPVKSARGTNYVVRTMVGSAVWDVGRGVWGDVGVFVGI